MGEREVDDEVSVTDEVSEETPWTRRKKLRAERASKRQLNTDKTAKRAKKDKSPPKVKYVARTMVVHRDSTGNIVEDGDVPEIVGRRYKEKIEPLLLQLTVMASQGRTNDELAAFLDMSRTCFDSYRKQFPALQASLDMCRNSTLDQVANSMFMAARGYSYMERKETKSPPDADGNVAVKVEEWTKWKAPDTTAGIFILTNKRPEEWKRQVDPNMYANTMSLTVGAANMSENVVKGLLQKFDAELFGAGEAVDVKPVLDAEDDGAFAQTATSIDSDGEESSEDW